MRLMQAHLRRWCRVILGLLSRLSMPLRFPRARWISWSFRGLLSAWTVIASAVGADFMTDG